MRRAYERDGPIIKEEEKRKRGEGRRGEIENTYKEKIIEGGMTRKAR